MKPSIKIQFRLTAGQLRFISITILVLLLLATSASSFAEEAKFKMLDAIDAGFAGKTAGWESIIRVYANRLFWLLAVIDFCYLSATFVLDKKEMDDIFHSIVKKVMTLGFFWFVLKTSHDWIPQILDSFTQIGQKAGGAKASTPDGIAVAGYDAAMASLQALDDLGVTEKIGAVVPAVLMALLIFLSFLWVAVQLLVAKIETSIAVGAGIILLGFGGSKWTTDMASKYMQYSIATGLKLMLLFLLIGMGQTLFNDIKIVGGDKFFESMLVTTGTALTYAFLATKIPALASAMMSGSPSMTAGDLTGAVVGAAAAVAGLGAAGMAAGKAGMGAASGGAAAATGVGQALKAGISSGQDFGKSGAGLAAHAVGEVGKHSMGLASAGIGDMLKGGASNFQSRVSESAGGRVATSIEAGRGGSMAGVAGGAAAGGAAAGGAAAGGAAAGGAAAGGAAAGGTEPIAGATQAASGAGSGESAPALPTSVAGAGESSSSVATGGQSTASIPGGASSNADGGVNGSAAPGVTPSAGAGTAGTSEVSPAARAPSSSGASTASSSTAPTPTGGNGGQAGVQPRTSSSPANGGGGITAPSGASTGPGTGLAGNAASQPANSAAVQQDAASTGNAGASAPTNGMPSTAAPMPSGGDASTGAVSSGNPSSKTDGGPREREQKSLHERIQGLQGYVPDDAAQSATLHIDMKHTE